MDPSRKRRLRGEILALARRLGIGGISVEGIENIYLRAGEHRLADNVAEALHYLADKGYVIIHRERETFSGVERRLVSISAQGIDLLDRTIDEDPGVWIAD